jgi:hypothetical protein
MNLCNFVAFLRSQLILLVQDSRMASTPKKRTLDAFFKPPIKKVKIESSDVKTGEEILLLDEAQISDVVSIHFSRLPFLPQSYVY